MHVERSRCGIPIYHDGIGVLDHTRDVANTVQDLGHKQWYAHGTSGVRLYMLAVAYDLPPIKSSKANKD
jgi:hypothetical protein